MSYIRNYHIIHTSSCGTGRRTGNPVQETFGEAWNAHSDRVWHGGCCPWPNNTRDLIEKRRVMREQLKALRNDHSDVLAPNELALLDTVIGPDR